MKIDNKNAKEIEIILDLGADASVAPRWIRSFGKRMPFDAKVRLKDVQGKLIPSTDRRIIDLKF